MSAFVIPLPPLTASDLISRGLFHDRIIPALTSGSLVHIMATLHAFADSDQVLKNGKWLPKKTTRCVRHSYPKRRLARRILSIPNPRNQIFLAREVEAHWNELRTLCEQSTISLTTPKVSAKRALQGSYERRAEGVERAKRSVGMRYVLHADLARFYPSIYTHSLPWAVHGKENRHNQSQTLYGNNLDLYVRETQSKQTGGIPVGPDTSYLLAEMMASTIDKLLQQSCGPLHGTRYIDDYHLYFASRPLAETALAELHRIASIYELDINDLKTSIEEVPEAIEPEWKTSLRSISLQKDDHATSFKAVFDQAATLAIENPQDGVFAYLVKKVEAVIPQLAISAQDWEILDSLLLRAAVGEPSALPTILRIFENNARQPVGAANALNSICIHHALLQQSSEVAWSLWSAKRLGVSLSQAVSDLVANVDDDVVALTALDLHSQNLLPTPTSGFTLWRSFMTSDALYSEHWLIAYEAYVQGWLPSLNGQDYIADDSYFSLLQSQIKFFDTSEDVDVPDDSGYDEDDSYEEDKEDEEDKDEQDDEDGVENG